MKYVKKLVLFTLFAINLVEQPAPEVIIEQGILSGKISEDGSFFEYVGIPYASTNITTRFQPPLPPPKWDGVYKATQEYFCAQALPFTVLGSEDCLKVNVYVPVMAKRPLAVMVYIHGGAFILGSGGKLLYGPEFLVKQDVILVTINYRLGTLGFLCLGIKEAPGNIGLRDQIAALKWVKKNIAAFGGDPDNVTIFGESAGGTSVGLLLASNAANGLYNKAIVQSGSSLTVWAINREPLLTAKLIVQALGYESADPYEIYQILSKVPYKELVSAKVVKILDLFFDPKLLHLPCVEKPLPGIEPVLPDLPYNIMKNKKIDVPLMYGSNSKEGFFLISSETSPETLEDRNDKYLFGSDLEFKSKEEAEIVAKKVKEFYFGDKRISMETILNMTDLYTHLFFEIPLILESEIYINNNNTSVYHYHFDYHGGRNFLKEQSGFVKEPGACHADDILYLFQGRIWPYRVNKEDQVIIDWMTKMFSNFAKYGDPTPPSSNDLPVRWEPSTKEELKFLYIDKEMKMGPMPCPAAYSLWKDLYEKYRRKKL
uniref:Carboxylic ester hydrolase n=1 Tax=Streltzoviella insularis TaxID=1206366 RepID=A0A7D5UMQ5_9NEOP|nr:carboxylesterase 5 [Streltzoviella insularis]